MDYSSYKTMCDSSLQQIRRSENKRQELDHKLQKMYQEKSECEKSIIKTLQSQQKENRRRAERNESILRQLERIDYQASSLAAKTERLKELKKQYERYLLTLWNRKRQGINTASNLGSFHPGPVSVMQDGLSSYQSSHYNPYGNEFSFNYPRFHALPTHAINPSPSFNYQHNQSYFRGLPSSQAENSIRTNNYRTTGAVAVDPHPQFSYPSTLQVRYDDLTLMPQYQQSVEKKSFYHNDSAINNDDMNLPTTINSIYSRNDSQQQHHVPHFPHFDDKSTAKSFEPIYQRNNQPLESHNYNSENLKMSETVYGKPFITPTPSTDSFLTRLSPKPMVTTLSAPSADIIYKDHSENISSIDTMANIHMSDGNEETESDGEKSNKARRNIRRSDSITGDVFHQKSFDETMRDGEVSFTKHDDSIANLHSQLGSSVKRPQGKNVTSVEEGRETSSINESMTNENLHQIWEKVVPVDVDTDTQVSSNFVIPKIVVETQIDYAEAPTSTLPATMHSTIDRNQDTIHENQDTCSPEKLLNHEMKKHSPDNQQNESLSSRPQLASTVNNNLPLEGFGSSIYHYDKQAPSDEQQKSHTWSVEHELRNFDDIKISDHDSTKDEDTATQNMTYESQIKSNNSLAEGELDDEGWHDDGEKETINNFNDDKNQIATSTTVALNDKINEIYRKIERIEGDYYDGKGKIIENFERKTSTSSMGDAAKLETQTMIDSSDTKYDAAEIEANQSARENVQEEANQNTLAPESVENAIYANDGIEWKSDQHQSEIIENWNGAEPQEMVQQNNDYEIQQNQEFSGSVGEYLQPIEGQVAPQFTSETIPGDVPYDQYPYEQTQQPFVEDPHQLQTEYVYPHHDNIQQDSNNYNPSYDTQSDSNYQQNNYEEAQEIPSNYTNDSGGVYYDYDQNQQQQQQLQTSTQIMYDDQNYLHHQPAQYQSNDEVEASQYFYENVDNKAETNLEHSNENNYGYVENLNEISGGSTSYNVNEYQTGDNTIYDNATNVYESQATNDNAPGNANYESQHFAQESNENSEQMNVESYGRDESYLTSTSTSESSKQLLPEANENANIKAEAEIQPTKLDDVKMVKQLLDSESDDATARSNLLQTSIKEEANESDFDFSTG